MKRKLLKQNAVPLLIAAASLVIMLFGIWIYMHAVNDLREKEVRNNLRNHLFLKKSCIEKALYSRIYYTKSVAAYVSMNPGISVNSFYRLAGEFITGDSVISTMALSKNYVIGAIYPIEGHESALGLNLLAHPKRKQIVEETVRTKKTFVAGPVELVEGGIAFISYTPIFTLNAKGEKEFWGVTDIVIRRDRLFNEAGLTRKDTEFNYGLKGYDGQGARGDIFWGDPDVFINDPVSVEVSLPTGNWVLAASPLSGWDEYLQRSDRLSLLLYVTALFISLLIWRLAYAQSRIRANARELAALFHGMEDLVIEFDKKGEYVKIAPTNDSHLVKPKNLLIGKTLHQVLDKETAELHFNAIQECLSEKSKVVIEYPILIGTDTRWFKGRFARMSESSVIFVAEDITQKKNYEEDLLRSQQQLRELNETKDKIFSLIAHDLRNPFTAFLGFTELIAGEISIMSREEIQGLAIRMRNAATSLLKQLEDLLEWSQLQRGMTLFNPEIIRLDNLAVICLEEVQEMTRKKGIKVFNEIDGSLEVRADKKMLKSILSNLLTNAVKFTKNGGSITISARKTESNETLVQVRDTGIGMNREILSGLFTMDLHISRKGTEGEPSTGLGLILCREFVDMHQGMIWAESEVAVGSTFYVKLPGKGSGLTLQA